MNTFFDEKKVELSQCLKFYFHWFNMAIDAVNQNYTLGKLDGVPAVTEALDTGKRALDKQVRDLGMIMGLEHEFVRYAETRLLYGELMEKAGKLMQMVVAREQMRLQDQHRSQAGNWLPMGEGA